MSLVDDGIDQELCTHITEAVDTMIERSNILNVVVIVLCPVLNNTLPQEVVTDVVSKVAKSSENVCGLIQVRL